MAHLFGGQCQIFVTSPTTSVGQKALQYGTVWEYPTLNLEEKFVFGFRQIHLVWCTSVQSCIVDQSWTWIRSSAQILQGAWKKTQAWVHGDIWSWAILKTHSDLMWA